VGVSNAQRAKTAKRRREACDMRLDGHSWQAIATKLRYASKGAAHTDVKRALEEAVAELSIPREALRELEVQRLDAELVRLAQMQAALWKDALAGDLKAIDAGVRIEEARRKNGKRRAELLDLDAPQRHELSMGDIDAALDTVRDKLAAAHREAAEADGAEGGGG
jgi:hypothetical protein